MTQSMSHSAVKGRQLRSSADEAPDDTLGDSLVVLVMREGRDRELLEQTLQTRYQVETTIDPDRLRWEFDCCVLDQNVFRQARDVIRHRKLEIDESFHPIVLLGDGVAGSGFDSGVWDYVDEIVEMPVQKEALHLRLRNLIKRRQGAVERAQQAEEIRRQNERLESFAGVISHDLRNPLTVARGRLQLAMGEVENDDLEVVSRAHERMESLIQDLLSYAEAGFDESDPQWIRLSTFFESCWTTVNTEDATLVTDSEGSIKGNHAPLVQLVENLIRNAIDHGGDLVVVKVGILSNGFYIEDDGPGIAPENRDQIFEEGYSSGGGGTGLGLSIIEDIVNCYDLEIEVVEGDLGGARFEIRGLETR